MYKDTHKHKTKEWRKIDQANGKPKKAGVAILVSDKTHFKQRSKETKKHYMMVKGSMHQQELAMLNAYSPNTGATRYIKQILNNLIRDLDSCTIIVGDFNTQLSI